MSKKILIIDEEREIRQTLSDVLVSEGYDVDVAESGESAIAKAHHVAYDVAITDYRLGTLTGYDTYKEIKKINANIKGIVITAYLEDAVDNDFHLEGVDHCFSKPFNNERLLSVLRDL